MALITRNGNSSIAPIKLKSSSNVRPTMRKGNKSSHNIGNKKTRIKANGQHSTNNMHHKIIATIVFIDLKFQNFLQKNNQIV